MRDVKLLLGDCLERMAEIPAGSVDLIAADLPYGTTACKWDQIIPLDPMWAAFRRVLKPRGAVVLTACQPFTSMLVMSNRKWFRFDDVWDKVGPTGFLDANRRPLRRHESILLFAPRGGFTFHPQMGRGEPYSVGAGKRPSPVYGAYVDRKKKSAGERCPASIIRISNANGKRRGKVHQSQKPVELMEYLIRTYSDPGATVLDPAAGSFTTGVACHNTGRDFIGIEKDPDIFATGADRLAVARRGVAA